MPLELWREIALSDVQLWYVLTRVVRGLHNEEDKSSLKNRGVTVETVTKNGITYREYRLDGLLHRDRGEGPATLGHKGTEYYYRNGVLHREDGPAVVQKDGSFKYYRNGVLHREDGPAVRVMCSGKTEYRRDGLLHRDPKEGPAATYMENVSSYTPIYVYAMNGLRVR